MIAYFPEIYPDELLYSQLARYFAHSGYMAYVCAAEDLFERRAVRPDIEFLNAYTRDALERITSEMPMENVIMRHTMFPYYGRFLPIERRTQAFYALLNMQSNYLDFLYMPTRKDHRPRKLRYCPMCAEEDRKRYGETYWHRLHQMIGVNICGKHHCQLIETDVQITSGKSPALIPAEAVAMPEEKSAISGCEIECRLVEYVSAVFQADVNLSVDTPIGTFLHSKLSGTKYLSARGDKRNIAELCDDFVRFYTELCDSEFTQLWKLQKVFTSDRFNTIEICMVALFLGIPVEELVNPTLPEQTQTQLFDAQIRELHDRGLNYRQIAGEMGASYDTVKAIGNGLYQKYHHCLSEPQKGGPKSRDWNSVDAATLPLVQDFIRRCNQDSTQRPVKITVGMVERRLGLPIKGLKNCRQCLAEIAKYAETQEEHWARVVAWAVDCLLCGGSGLTLSKILKLTNIRKRDFESCLPYLSRFADLQTVSLIESLE